MISDHCRFSIPFQQIFELRRILQIKLISGGSYIRFFPSNLKKFSVHNASFMDVYPFRELSCVFRRSLFVFYCVFRWRCDTDKQNHWSWRAKNEDKKALQPISKFKYKFSCILKPILLHNSSFWYTVWNAKYQTKVHSICELFIELL